MRVCPPSPVGNTFSRSSLFSLNLFQRQAFTVSPVFILLCLTLGISSASAQTRPTRTGVRSEERLRRVDEKEQADAASEPAKVYNLQPPQQPSQVRKTALSYPARNAERPALTNDIVIISRAPAASSARSLAALKAGAASANVPSIWPVVGELRSGVGMRSNPFGGSSVEFHKGQDISAPMGTPVIATADGVVVIARWMKGYGQGIYVDHGNGISTRYGHLSRIDVVEGQPIKRGEQLGLVGSTGRSTGPHLHYEVRINGQPTSPLPYLPIALAPPAAQ